VSRRAGIGYAIARRLAALGAGLFLHHHVPHDRDQPWGADPGGPGAVVSGVAEALIDGAAVHDLGLDDPARLIAWLVTDEAAWIIGQVINSEGGFRR
jgi:3-oxoacyl-[acyl-carrier protein] reductase